MDINAQITEKAETLRVKLRAKLGVRARTYAKAMHKARNLLPKHVRTQGAMITDAQNLGGNPKLMRMVDMGAIERAYASINQHLDNIDLADQRKGWWLSWLGGNALNILIVLGGFITWLIWSGAV